MSEGAKLTKKEQATTTAYKLMCDKVNKLEDSLKAIQNENEKLRNENTELDRRNIILEEKNGTSFVLESCKFISASGIGIAVNFLFVNKIEIGIALSVPFLLLYLLCIYLDSK